MAESILDQDENVEDKDAYENMELSDQEQTNVIMKIPHNLILFIMILPILGERGTRKGIQRLV